MIDNALSAHPYLCSVLAEEMNSWAKDAFALIVMPREAIWHNRSNASCDRRRHQGQIIQTADLVTADRQSRGT